MVGWLRSCGRASSLSAGSLRVFDSFDWWFVFKFFLFIFILTFHLLSKFITFHLALDRCHMLGVQNYFIPSHTHYIINLWTVNLPCYSLWINSSPCLSTKWYLSPSVVSPHKLLNSCVPLQTKSGRKAVSSDKSKSFPTGTSFPNPRLLAK